VNESTTLARQAETAKPANIAVGGPTGGLTPQNIEQMWRMAVAFSKSGMMPRGIQSPEQVFVAIEMGAEVGLAPMQAVQNIAVINGRPNVWGDAMLGLVQGSGLLEGFQEKPILDTAGRVVGYECVAKRKGINTPFSHRYTVDDAKTAGLWGKTGPWTTVPTRMLQMRARSWTLRDGFADVLKGLMAREEAEDIVAVTATVVDAEPVKDVFTTGRDSIPPPTRNAEPVATPEPDAEYEAVGAPQTADVDGAATGQAAASIAEIEAFLSSCRDQDAIGRFMGQANRVTPEGEGKTWRDADDADLERLLGTARDLANA